MNCIKYLCLIFPIFLSAQDVKVHSQTYDWIVENDHGVVLWVDGDSICYEEKWVHPSPGGCTITSNSNPVSRLSDLKAPFYAEITYYGVGKRKYFRSMRVLVELEYDERGHVLGLENIQTY